jgi:hypothetical protein
MESEESAEMVKIELKRAYNAEFYSAVNAASSETWKLLCSTRNKIPRYYKFSLTSRVLAFRAGRMLTASVITIMATQVKTMSDSCIFTG